MYSCKNWNKTSIRYDQENNVIEIFLSKLKQAGQSTFRLESCGVEAASCAVEAVGGKWVKSKPKYLGYGDMMFNYLNSPKNKNKLAINSNKYPNNEYIENLEIAVSFFSNCKTDLHYLNYEKDIVPELKMILKRKSAAVISYKTDYDSYHYITIVAYKNNNFIIYDSWKGNQHCKNGGVLEEYTEKFISERSRLRILEIYV